LKINLIFKHFCKQLAKQATLNQYIIYQ
jgi:hypothetical protein